MVASGLIVLLSVTPACLSPLRGAWRRMAFLSWFIPKQIEAEKAAKRDEEAAKAQQSKESDKDSVKSVLKTAEIELLLGKQVSTRLLGGPSGACLPRR